MINIYIYIHIIYIYIYTPMQSSDKKEVHYKTYTICTGQAFRAWGPLGVQVWVVAGFRVSGCWDLRAWGLGTFAC